MTPFKAVLLGCDQGHYEATTESSMTNNLLKYGLSQGAGQTCNRCGHELRLVKTVTIRPGGAR